MKGRSRSVARLASPAERYRCSAYESVLIMDVKCQCQVWFYGYTVSKWKRKKDIYEYMKGFFWLALVS